MTQKRRHWKKLPIIPGIVYKGLTNAQSVCLLGIVFAGLILVTGISPGEKLAMVALFIVIAWTALYIETPKPRLVHLSRTHLKAEFSRKKIIFQPLEKYYLHIREAPKIRYPSKNFAYEISLLSKDYVNIVQNDKLIHKAGKNDRFQTIILCPRIYIPENVREYIDALQSQIDSKLEIIFGSDQIAQNIYGKITNNEPQRSGRKSSTVIDSNTERRK